MSAWISDTKCPYCNGSGSIQYHVIDPEDIEWHLKSVPCHCTRKTPWWWPLLCVAVALILTLIPVLLSVRD